MAQCGRNNFISRDALFYGVLRHESRSNELSHYWTFGQILDSVGSARLSLSFNNPGDWIETFVWGPGDDFGYASPDDMLRYVTTKLIEWQERIKPYQDLHLLIPAVNANDSGQTIGNINFEDANGAFQPC